jgi:hypothetical protein
MEQDHRYPHRPARWPSCWQAATPSRAWGRTCNAPAAPSSAPPSNPKHPDAEIHRAPGPRGPHGPRERRHRRHHPQAVPQVDPQDGLRPQPVRRMALPRPARRAGVDPNRRASPTRTSCSTSRATPAPPSCWPARTSAAAPAASTRPGRWTSTAFAPSWRPALPTSSSTTASRTACCPSCCPNPRVPAVRRGARLPRLPAHHRPGAPGHRAPAG